MASNRLDHIQSHKLITYLEDRAGDDRKIDGKIGQIAHDAEIALGFKVVSGNVSYLAKRLGITWVKIKPAANGAANGSDVYLALGRIEDRLTEIENRLTEMACED